MLAIFQTEKFTITHITIIGIPFDHRFTALIHSYFTSCTDYAYDWGYIDYANNIVIPLSYIRYGLRESNGHVEVRC